MELQKTLNGDLEKLNTLNKEEAEQNDGHGHAKKNPEE